MKLFFFLYCVLGERKHDVAWQIPPAPTAKWRPPLLLTDATPLHLIENYHELLEFVSFPLFDGSCPDNSSDMFPPGQDRTV